jgi:FkbM family methyltransferase
MEDQIIQISQKIINKLKHIRKTYIFRSAGVEQSEQIFYISYLKAGMTAFDVGANMGEITLLFSRFVGSSGQVHAFEASQETFEQLTTVCQIANRGQIQLNHCAVADTEGVLQFNVYDQEYSGWNSLANRPLQDYGIDVQPSHQETVNAITLDHYCELHQIDSIDLLKIDVEGAEYQVMLGAQSLFKSQRIRCCVFEFGQTTFDMGNTPEQIEAFLKSCGYRVKNIVKGEPRFPGRKSRMTAEFSLHIATPKPRL